MDNQVKDFFYWNHIAGFCIVLVREPMKPAIDNTKGLIGLVLQIGLLAPLSVKEWILKKTE